MQKKKTRKMYFNFKRIHKKEVYQAFLAIYAHGGIELTNEELISFLARYTNLGSEALAVRPVSRRFSTVISNRSTSEFTRVYKLLIQGRDSFLIFVSSLQGQ